MVEYVATVYASAEFTFSAASSATKEELRERVPEHVETGDLGGVKVREVRRSDE